MARAPFRVSRRRDGKWVLTQQLAGHAPNWAHGPFSSAGEAIDCAYKNWPWWL